MALSQQPSSHQLSDSDADDIAEEPQEVTPELLHNIATQVRTPCVGSPRSDRAPVQPRGL